MPAGPSFEAELRAAREARGLSISDLQQETRIPVDVLARFEEGRLLGDPSFNEVYLRAFLKMYAKAIGLPQQVVLDGYAALRGGTFQGLQQPADVEQGGASALASPPRLTPLPDAPPPVRTSEASRQGPQGPRPQPGAGTGARREALRLQPEAPPSQPEASAPASAVPPAVAALSGPEPPRAEAPAAPPQPGDSFPKRRVERPPVQGAKRSFDRNWGAILGLAAGLLLLIGAAVYLLVLRPSDPEPNAPQGSATPAAADGPAADAPAFTLPIQVRVTARGDGLQWFRTETDGGTRTPNWVNAGSEQIFEAESSLVLFGEGTQAGAAGGWSDATLTLQGLTWTPPEGATVRINAERGQALLDSLARGSAAPTALPPAAMTDAPVSP